MVGRWWLQPAGVVVALFVASEVALGCSCDGQVFVAPPESGSGAGSSSGGASSGGGSAGGGSSSGGASSGTSSSGGSTGTKSGSGGAPTDLAECDGHIYECGDIEDNDGDGLIDSRDPDCLGPCDNTEDSYHSGIGCGQSGCSPCRVDCYFDGHTGHLDDDCFWNHQCDPHEVAPKYYPRPNDGTLCEYDPKASTYGTSKSCDELEMSQSELCLDFCGPLTPNGCDCFGCCELPAGSNQFVWLGSVGEEGYTVCTADKVIDPTVCHPCKPVTACFNDCAKCELCITKATLPPECFGAEGGSGGSPGNSGQCPEDVQPCGLPGQGFCSKGYYCITGCCQPVPE